MPFADMVRNRPERGTRCGCQVHEKSLDKDGPSCNRSERHQHVISLGKFGDACILLTTQEGTLRFYACNVLGHSLYTVYTRSSRHSCTHHSGGAATHSNSLSRLTPRRSRAQAARQQPRPVVDLRRPVHAPPVFIGMNMGANSWSMNASVCVTTSTPPHTHAARVVPARHVSRPQRRRTHLRATQEFASGVHSFNNSRHRGIMMLTL